MGRSNPGGDPGDIMYDAESKPIGLTHDGRKLLDPKQYSETDRRWLETAVNTRGGIEMYSTKDRAYISSVLRLAA